MPLGEIIAEIFIRGILEVIVYGLAYYTGALVLTLASFGRLRLAPLETFQDRNRGEKWWSGNIWLLRPGRARALRAEWICVFGLFVWAVAGFAIYFSMKLL
ncbi:MAG: hypothetical protein V4689_03150 [Verrucomicrobiota bacterium]